MTEFESLQIERMKRKLNHGRYDQSIVTGFWVVNITFFLACVIYLVLSALY